MNPCRHSRLVTLAATCAALAALAACSSVSLNPAPVVERSTTVTPTPAPVEPAPSPLPGMTPLPSPAPAPTPAPPAEVIDRSVPATSSSSSSSPYPSRPPAGRQTTYPYAMDGSYQGEMIGMPAVGSAFSRVRIGMTFQQVQELIGAPQRVYTQQTGKAWIPFYYGNDASRINTLFPGEGCLTFTGGNKLGYGANELIRIDVDPSGTCYQP